MRTRWLSLLAGPIAAGLLLSGCGGDDSSDAKVEPKDEKLKPGQLRVKLKLVWEDGAWKVAENTRIA